MTQPISRHKLAQEKVAALATPLFKATHFCLSRLASLFKAEGLAYGIHRARWRAKVARLGEFSDISPGVVIKNPSGLEIGMRSSISTQSFLDAGGGILIGDYVMISHAVSINSQSHPSTPPYHGLVKRRTVIGSHSWIGAHAVILDGVKVGEGAIVAAGAVVTNDVPAWTVAAGVPARVIKAVQKPDSSASAWYETNEGDRKVF